MRDASFIHIISFNFFFFWLYCTAYGILVPQPGIKPGPPAVEVPSPNHWTARELSMSFNSCDLFHHRHCHSHATGEETRI